MHRIQPWLDAHGKMTLTKFSRRAHISIPLLSMYDRGVRHPGLNHAVMIEKATDGEIPHTAWLAGPVWTGRRKPKRGRKAA